MTPEGNPRKPEWFELADSSAESAQVRKINKVLPSIAVLVSAAVIGAGAFFANASESSSSSIAAPILSGAVAGEPSVSSQSQAALASTPAVANPAAIGVAPPRGGGDDDDDDYEDEEDDDDDDEDDDYEDEDDD